MSSSLGSLGVVCVATPTSVVAAETNARVSHQRYAGSSSRAEQRLLGTFCRKYGLRVHVSLSGGCLVLSIAVYQGMSRKNAK
jgi:hypothetical protein